MKIRIDFRTEPSTVSFSVWETSSDVVASAILSALFQAFPDSLQNLASSAPPGEVHLRTKSRMPTEWADGSVKATSE